MDCDHGRRKVHDYFLLLLCKSSIWFTEKHIKIILYFFNTSKCTANYFILFDVHIWWFHRSKDFEAMKAWKSAIRPWLICQYNENTLVDLLSSVIKVKNIRNNNFSRKERDVVIKTSYKFELGIMSLAVFWLPVQLSIFVNYLLLLLPKVFLLQRLG